MPDRADLAEARLLPGKALDNFDISVVWMLSKARIMALAAGGTRLDKATNVLLFGPSRDPFLLGKTWRSSTFRQCGSPWHGNGQGGSL